MDLTDYHNSINEISRVRDLMQLLPLSAKESALDIGARDGFISKQLTNHFAAVTALDLEIPSIEHNRIHCVKGDITKLDFPDATFDLIFCAEVLEHIPPTLLETACRELTRVSKKYILIGVPYRQDIRVGRTTCRACDQINPPWGHVNQFDERRLAELFPELVVEKSSFVGENNEHTNSFSCTLMDLSGNPYGTYSQEESCIHCGATLIAPADRRFWQKVLTKLAFTGMKAQRMLTKTHPNWIHLLLRKVVD